MEHVQSVSPNQQGIAAIEFALSITIVLMLFFGIVTYGALFWTQQKVSQLAAEGGRYAVAASMRQTLSLSDAVCTQHIEKIAKNDLLLKSLPTGESDNKSTPFCQLTVSTCPNDPEEPTEESNCATITITADVTEKWPLMTIMRGLAGVFTNQPKALVPEQLTSVAVVQIM